MTWRQKDLKPQAASLLGKKHKSVSLVSSTTCANAPTGGGGDGSNIRTATPTKPTSPFTNWSAKKSSYDDDERDAEGKHLCWCLLKIVRFDQRLIPPTFEINSAQQPPVLTCHPFLLYLLSSRGHRIR